MKTKLRNLISLVVFVVLVVAVYLLVVRSRILEREPAAVREMNKKIEATRIERDAETARRNEKINSRGVDLSD